MREEEKQWEENRKGPVGAGYGARNGDSALAAGKIPNSVCMDSAVTSSACGRVRYVYLTFPTRVCRERYRPIIAATPPLGIDGDLG